MRKILAITLLLCTVSNANAQLVLPGGGSGGGGSGTVTTLSIVTANGVSGSVANPTTTPAVTLTLGAITPTTVNGVTISTLAPLASPSFTGTITLPVTGSTQCLHVNTSGVLSGTGSDCGSGGGGGLTVGSTGITSGTTTNILFDNAGILGEYTITGTGTVVAMAASPTFTGTVSAAALNTSGTYAASGQITNSDNSAASAPAVYLTGTIFTGGSGTTTFPHYLIQPNTATASTTWSTTGTAFGINAHTGVGNLADWQLDGASKLSVTSAGAVTAASFIASGALLQAGAAFTIGWNGRGLMSSTGTGVVQFGTTDAASPVAQTLRAQGGSGTNIAAAASLTVLGPLGTGTGTNGDLLWRVGVKTTTGTTVATATTAVTIKGETLQSNFAGIISPQNSFTPTAGSGAASVAGNDQSFVVTTGTAQTSITVNFGHTWAAAPVCIASSNSTASTVDISTTTTTAITYGASVALTGALINTHCFGT